MREKNLIASGFLAGEGDGLAAPSRTPQACPGGIFNGCDSNAARAETVSLPVTSDAAWLRYDADSAVSMERGQVGHSSRTQSSKEGKMMKKHCFVQVLATFLVSGLLCVGVGENALAHCDTLDGPVVQTARTALEKGDITPVLKWVRADDEKEIRAAFQRTLAVRAKGAEAKELADRYFFETLVRVHRAGEGAPYTGLKPGVAIDPAVALADKALESGSVDKLVGVLTNAMSNGIRERFQHARETQKQADNSVAAGREFVKNYVIFTHYVEGLHAVVKGRGGHHGEETKGDKGHNH